MTNTKIKQLNRAAFMLPNGRMVLLSPEELKEYMTKNKLQLHQPSYQGSSIEDEQVGIKSY